MSEETWRLDLYGVGVLTVYFYGVYLQESNTTWQSEPNLISTMGMVMRAVEATES